MRDQADLGEQAQRHPGGEREKGAVTPQLAHPCGRRAGDGRLRGQRIAVGRLAQLLRRDGENLARQHGDHRHHRQPDPQGRLCEAGLGDQKHPQRREHDAAHAGAVVGHAQRGGTPAHEPGRYQRIDRRGAQGHPAHAAERRGGIQLPGRSSHGPAGHAQRQECRAAQGYLRDPDAPVQARQVGHDHGAGQEVQRDGAGHQRHAPAGALDHGVQEHGRAVEAHAPAEDGKDECGVKDFPAEEGRG
ncbi:hypothetical protein D3C71_1365750 [compost metagenome]